MNKYTHLKNKGQAVMIAVIFFLLISVSLVVGVVTPTVHRIKMVREINYSRESYFAAEALVEDVVYRLNHNMTVAPSESLTLNNSTVDVDVTTTSEGKTVETRGDTNGHVRKIRTSVITGVGVAFNYGLQSGNGGFNMANNSRVVGNVYSNGSISGGSVTGDAIAANSISLISDQTNNTPLPPSQNISFRDTTGTQDFAQSFQVSIEAPINKIQVYIRKVGAPANPSVRIVTDNAGTPSATNLLSSQGTLNASNVTTSYGWVDVVFPSNPVLSPGVIYWFVIDSGSQSSSNYYVIGGNTGYSSGGAKIGQYGLSWSNTSPVGLDGYFTIFLGGLTSTINNVNVGGFGWAHTISGGSISGTKYCQIGSGCNTSRSDPSPAAMPLSDANIAQWNDEAEAGGTITGNYTPANGSRLGPKKITGNLTISNNAIVTITGTLHVQGNIIIDNGAQVILSSSYGSNSGAIIADGLVTVQNNSQFSGSGTIGSYILIATTSDCPISSSCSGANAMTISNNAGTVILNAQNGTLHLSNNAGAKEATAYTISMDNGAEVIYETGLANLNFSSGPSGSWNIKSWKEIE